MKSLASFFITAVLSSASKLKHKEDCLPRVDLVILQDLTTPIPGNLTDKLPAFAQRLGDAYPELLRIGVGVFNDKTSSDPICYSTYSPLSQNVNLSVAKLVDTRPREDSKFWGGNQLGAMMRAAVSPHTGWLRMYRRKEHNNNEAGDHCHTNKTIHYQKMILIVTNAIPNEPAFWEDLHGVLAPDIGQPINFKSPARVRCCYPFSQDNLQRNPEFLDVEENRDCLSREYPSWLDWGNIMKGEHILPIFIVGKDVGKKRDPLCAFAKTKGRKDCFGFDTNRKNGIARYYNARAKEVRVPIKSVQYNGKIEAVWNVVVKELDRIKDACYPTEPCVSTTTTV